MDIQIYWQAIVVFLAYWLLGVCALGVFRKVYFPKSKIRWGIIAAWFVVVAIAGLASGRFLQKTHLPEQHEIVDSMQGIMQDDERVLDNYLNSQPNRELGKTAAERDEELRIQQEKNRKLIEGTK